MVIERRFFVNLVREVLRLKLVLKQSNRQIANAKSISKSTVATYVNRSKSVSLINYSQVESLTDEELNSLIFPSIKIRIDDIDYEYIQKELRRKNVTLRLLWEELSRGKADYHGYSWFCERFKEWSSSQEISLRIVHKAGEKAFIDYAGTTVPIKNSVSGQTQEAQIFIMVLGASSYTYLEATWTQKSEDFISSNLSAFEYFGGVPHVLVPDNLKAGVNESCKYEPQINRNYRDMAKHYNAVVIPARAYRPKDKAKVENGVLVASRWILASIRNMTFFSLEELNEVLRSKLEEFNQKKFQKMDGSRKSFFEELDKQALKLLPPTRYTLAEWKEAYVNIDYHICIDYCYYSTPYRLRGKSVHARCTETTIEIFLNGNRVASHPRLSIKGSSSTLKEHMPIGHQEYLGWTPSSLTDWAQIIGPSTLEVISILLEKSGHPELGHRSGLGVKRLEKSYGSIRLEKACGRALAIGGVSYKSIKSILEKGLESQPLEELEKDSDPLEHSNIRGEEYYQ